MSQVEKNVNEDNSSTEPAREKGVFAPLALLTLILAPIVIAASIFVSNSEIGNYTPPVSGDLKTTIVLSAPQFLEFGTGNVCDGKAPLAGLSRATLQINTDLWSRTTPLGEGTLNSQGQCLYKATVTPDSAFLGGEIEASITFSFGKTEKYIIDVGDSLPFSSIDLNISLG
jgi:hypothetical protein